MKYIYTHLFIWLCILLGIQQGALAQVSLRLPDTTVILGKSIDIPIYADTDLTGKDVYSYRLEINYDNQQIRFVQTISTNTLIENYGDPTVNSNNEGVVILAGAGSTPLSGKGVLCYLRFEAIDDGYSAFSFNTSQSYLNEGSPALNFDNGSVSVNLPPKLTISPNSGNLIPNATLAFRASGGTSPYQWSVSNSAIASIDASTGVLTALKAGFVKVSAIGQGGIAGESDAINIRPARLSIPDTSAWKNEKLLLPIYTTDLTNQEILSGEITVSYNEDHLLFEQLVTTGTVLEGLSVQGNGTGAGVFKLAFANSTPISGKGVLAYIEFQVKDTQGQSSLKISQAVFNQNLLPEIEDGYFRISYSNIIISGYASELFVGDSLSFSARSGVEPYTWSVSDESVASIDDNGQFIAKKTGQVTVTVTDSKDSEKTTSTIDVFGATATISQVTDTIGTFVHVPIRLDYRASGEGAYSFQTTIKYPTDQVQIVYVIRDSSLVKGWNVNYRLDLEEGLVHIAGASSTPITDSGVLCWLRVRLLSGMLQNPRAPLTFESLMLNEGSPLVIEEDGYIDGEYHPIVAAVEQITPNKGGNTGDVTMYIRGLKFTDSTSVVLRKAGFEDIVPDTLFVVDSTLLAIQLDLREKEVGKRDVVVDFGEGTVITETDGFEVEDGRLPELWMELEGRSDFRLGRSQTYTLSYGNSANIDARGVPFWIIVPKSATVEFGFNIIDPTNGEMEAEGLKEYTEIDSLMGEPFQGKAYGLLIPFVTAQEVSSMQFRVTGPSEDFEVYAWIEPPLYGSPLKYVFGECFDAIVSDLADAVPNPVFGCAYGVFDGISTVIVDGINGEIKKAPGSYAINYSLGLAKTLFGCASIGKKLTTWGKFVKGTLDVATGSLPIKKWGSVGPKCFAPKELNPDSDEVPNRQDPVYPIKKINKKEVRVVASMDPNEKAGIKGNSTENYIQSHKQLSYKIMFENIETATAAAQEVIVVDTLDVTKVDASTYELGDISFGDIKVVVPPGLQSYQTDVDLRPANNLIVRVTGVFNPSNGVARWRFESLDPFTMLFTEDPVAGFLPPNKNAPEGDGYVTYTVSPKQGIASGTEIRNKALIFFDSNAPIITNEWVNTIDDDLPNSQIQPLELFTLDSTFSVNWTGQDTTANDAIYYNIYYGVNDSTEHQIWKYRTQELTSNFPGEVDSTYYFYIVAIDDAGNEEPWRGTYDAITTVVPPNRVPYIDKALDTLYIFNEDTDPAVITYSLDSVFKDDDIGDILTFSATIDTTAISVYLSNDSLYLSFEQNYHGSALLTVTAQDQVDSAVSQVVRITVLPINDAPDSLWANTNTIAENSALGTFIGVLSNHDPDVGDRHVYQLVAGEGDSHNSLLSIEQDTVKVGGLIDYENTDSLYYRIAVTDSSGASFEKAFSILVEDVNERPIDLILDNDTIAENGEVGSLVSIITATDPDLNNAFTYRLVAGDGDIDNGSFSISNDSLKALAVFDFETKNTYNIRIAVTDEGGLSYEKVFIINIKDINEAPNNLSLDNTSIEENKVAGTKIGDLTATDPDTGDSFTYSLVAGSGGTGNVSFQISGSELQAATAFDFETQNSYSIRVQALDAGGLSVVSVFNISITDANDAPSAINLDNSSIDENAGTGAVVGSLSAVDDGNSFTYSLVSGEGDTDNASFQISGEQLQASASFDFELKSSYSIRISVADAGGLSFEKTFTISITDVNESPTDLSLSNNSIAENQASGTKVGDLTATDPDAGDTFTYSFVAGEGDADNASFQVSGDELQVAEVFDFEMKSSYSIRLAVTDAGGLSFEQVFAVNVTDVNDAPSTLALDNSSIEENNDAGAIVGTLSATDQDDTSFTYSLITGEGDADNASFQINGDQLQSAESFDFEAKSSYSIRLAVSDDAGGSFEQAFSISIIDQNEAPTAIALTPMEVVENLPSGTLVGDFVTTDPDTGDSFTYELVSGGVDNGNFQISDQQLLTANVFDFEAKSSFNIRVKSTDAGGLSVEQGFVITIIDDKTTVTALDLEDFSQSLLIYPNPVMNNELRFSIENELKTTFKVALYNTAGQLIHEQVLEKQQREVSGSIDVGGLPSGNYVLRISDASHQAVKVIQKR